MSFNKLQDDYDKLFNNFIEIVTKLHKIVHWIINTSVNLKSNMRKVVKYDN